MGEDDEGEGEGGSEEDCRGIDRPPLHHDSPPLLRSLLYYRLDLDIHEFRQL